MADFNTWLGSRDKINTTYQGLGEQRQQKFQNIFTNQGAQAATDWMRGLNSTPGTGTTQPDAQKGVVNQFLSGHEKINTNFQNLTPEQQTAFRQTFRQEGQNQALDYMRGLKPAEETPPADETPTNITPEGITPPDTSQAPAIDEEAQQAQTDFLYPEAPSMDQLRGDVTAQVDPFSLDQVRQAPGDLNYNDFSKPGEVNLPGRTQTAQWNDRINDQQYNSTNFMGDVKNDPYAQWRISQGQTALDKKLASMGLGDSGAALQQTMDMINNITAEESNAMWGRAQDNANRASQIGLANQSAGLQARGMDINAGTAERGQDLNALLTGRGQDVQTRMQDIGVAQQNAANQLNARSQDLNSLLQARGQDTGLAQSNAGNLLSAYGLQNNINQANANRMQGTQQFDATFNANQNQNSFNNLMQLVNTSLQQNPTQMGFQAAQANATNYQNLANTISPMIAANYPQFGGGGGGGGQMPWIPPYPSQPSQFPGQLAGIFGNMASDQGWGNTINQIVGGLASMNGG